MPKIWVDADAAPRVIKEVLIKASQRRGIKIVFIANSWFQLPRSDKLKWIQVAAGADVADDYIVSHCEAADLIITADIPLAARVIEKGALALRPRGGLLDAGNIAQKLSIRDFSTELRDMGINTGGAPPFDAKAKQRFSNALDRWLTTNGF